MVKDKRDIALKILLDIDQNNSYVNISLNKYLKQNKLDNDDKKLISKIVYGVIENKLLLDYLISINLKMKINKLNKFVLNILRMSAYQSIFLDIPQYAITNSSVELAKRYTNKGATGLVNAVSKKFNKQLLQKVDEIEDFDTKISIKYSIPIKIIKLLKTNYSNETIEEIAKVYNLKKSINIRVNNLKANNELVKQNLKKQNIEFEDSGFLDFLEITNGINLDNLEMLKNGQICIQDKLSALPAIVLNPKDNEYILDACAAPGMKTSYLSQLSKDKAKILAIDIHDHRCKLIEQNVKSQGIKNIDIKCSDSTKINEEFLEKFDKILLDVPCMGLGVVRSKKDIKYSKDIEKLDEITKLQKNILDVNSKYLKKGGILVYSTCSILKQENDDIINCFLEQNKDFKKVNIDFNCEEYKNVIDEKTSKKLNEFVKDETFQSIPTKDFEGFYIAKLQKV